MKIRKWWSWCITKTMDFSYDICYQQIAVVRNLDLNSVYNKCITMVSLFIFEMIFYKTRWKTCERCFDFKYKCSAWLPFAFIAITNLLNLPWCNDASSRSFNLASNVWVWRFWQILLHTYSQVDGILNIEMKVLTICCLLTSWGSTSLRINSFHIDCLW